MTIWVFGSAACCCQPGVAGGVIYADLRSELNTHLAPQTLFTESSPGREPLLQAFPFPSTLGKLALHLLSQACLFIYSSHGKWAFPPLLWSFPLTATFTSFPTPGCYACATASAFSGQLVVRDFPSPHPSVLRAPHPLCYVSFLLLLLILFSFFPLFPWVGVGLSRGLCWSGPGLSVGVPHAAYLTLWSSSQVAWMLVSGCSTGALLVSLFNMKWECYAQAGGVEELKFCLFSVVFPISVSPVSLQDFTLGGMLSASSL
jgi:hypothetical protein